jgi:hypothetical protein
MQNNTMKLSLYYLGQRNYVNGLTLLEEMLTSFCQLTGQKVTKIEKIDYFKVNKFVRNNCLFTTKSENRFSTDELKSSAAMLNLSSGGRKHICLLHQIDGSSVVKHLPDYDRGHYVGKILDGKFDKQKVFLREVSTVTDLLRGIIEANHRFCLNEAKKAGLEQRASWAYLKNLGLPDIKQYENCWVEFELKSVVDIYEKVFIIRQIKLRDLEDISAELCFFLDK